MIYKVVFKHKEETGVNIIETKFKGIRRVSANPSGISFTGPKNEVIAFIPHESLLYTEKVETLKHSDLSRLRNLRNGDQIYIEQNDDLGVFDTFTVNKVDKNKRFINVVAKESNGVIVVNVPFDDVRAILPSLDSWNKGYGIHLIERG